MLTILSMVFALLVAHLYLHIHVTEYGKLVVHSHLSGSECANEDTTQSNQGHSHTNTGYYFNKTFSDKDKIIPIIAESSAYRIDQCVVFTLASDALHVIQPRFDYTLRAPPD